MMKAVVITKFGGPEELKIGEVEKPQLGAINTVLVRVKAAGLNRADCAQREGNYPPPLGSSDILGLEIAGIIEDLTNEAKEAGFSIGERVMALLPGGGYAQYVAIPHGMLIRLPESMSFEEGAVIPEAFYTAWQALVWICGLSEKTNTVLIHAGASGVGTSAIQICKTIYPHVKVYVTAGSQDKIEYCKKIGAIDGANYKEGPWAETILKFISPIGGFDIVMDFIGASYFEQNIKVLRVDGKMVILAGLGGNKIPSDVDISPILYKRLTVSGSTLRARPLDYKIKLTQDIVQHLLPKFHNGDIKPVVCKTFKMEDVKGAHEYMEANQNMGKIVLSIE